MKIFITLAIAASLVGCTQDQKLFGPSLMPRAQAGKAISNPDQRDEALRSVALDSIHDGDAITANEAIDGMRPSGLKDDVAARCSEWLSRNRRAGEATGIAKKIENVEMRDHVLMAIATSRP